MNAETEHQTPPNWNDVLELASNCDGVVRQSSLALIALHSRGEVDQAVVERLARQLSDYKRALEQALTQVPGANQDVTEDDHPIYLKAFIEVADVKDALFDDLLPEMGELTETVTGSNPLTEHTEDEESTNESA